MHLLALEHVNQLHLLLERLEQLVPLPLQLSVLVDQPVLISSHSLCSACFVHFSLAEGQLQLLYFFHGSVQLGILVALLLVLAALVPLLDINLFICVSKCAFVVLNLLVLLGNLIFELGYL